MVNVDLIKAKLLVEYPNFGDIIINTKFIESDIQTAATDGYDIYYNKNFLNSLSKQQQYFLFAHEIYHIGLDHIERGKEKDPEVWNIATDSVINSRLKVDGFKLIKGCIDIEEAITKDSEEMYDILLQEKKENENNNQNSSVDQEKNNYSNNTDRASNGSSESDSEENEENKRDSQTGQVKSNGDSTTSSLTNKYGKTIDDHSSWNEEKTNESDSKDNNQQEEDAQEQERKRAIDEAKRRISQTGEKNTFKQNKEEKQKKIDELADVLDKDNESYGNEFATGEPEYIDPNNRTPKIIIPNTKRMNWNVILKRNIFRKLDWSYEDAIIENGIVKQSLSPIESPSTEILIDTSGSINEKLLKGFLEQVKYILKVSKVKIGCFDDRFYGFTDIHTQKDLDSYQTVGGGGNDFDIIVDSFSKKSDNKIVFTDGRYRVGDGDKDITWIVFDNPNFTVKYGRVFHVSSEDIIKLNLEIEEEKQKVR